MAAARAIARRAFSDSRVRNWSYAVLFALTAVAQPTAYRHAYPTIADRLGLARSLGANKAVRLFYGVPHDLLTVGGYTTWRIAALMSIFAALWGVLAAVRVMRGEEDSGRQELVLSGAVTRRTAFLAALAAIAAGAVVLWLALLLALIAGELPAGGSAYLALATLSVVPVFVGVGALTSQLAQTRRLALELGSGVLAVALLLRVVADTSSGLDWLRWLTPLGWVEEMRPFAGPRPVVLLLPILTGALLLCAAGAIVPRRDIGGGLLSVRESAPPRLRLLGSPISQAFRGERGSLTGWLVGIGFFALIVGMLSHAFTSSALSPSLRRQLHKLGGASFTTPSGALGFYFLFFLLVISLFGCSQIAAVRREEAGQQLETLFSLPVGRRQWLGGRLALAAATAVAFSLCAGALAWLGAVTQGGGVSLADMIGAGANLLPASLLFLALGALGFAALPRAGAGIAYGVVAVAFVWELFGGLLGAPTWSLSLSPFHEVGLVPAQPLKATAAVVMLIVAGVAAAASTALFARRDLTGH